MHIGRDRIGPHHAGVLRRRAGSIDGFDYSPALKTSTAVWNAATLEQWHSDPESLIPGQRMGYRLADPLVRTDVIAHFGHPVGAEVVHNGDAHERCP